MRRQGFAALWVLLALTVVPVAFVLVVDGAAAINGAAAGQAALQSATILVQHDPAQSWAGAVVADLPPALARYAEVGTGSTDVTLEVPLPIPLGGVHAVRLVVHDPTTTAAEGSGRYSATAYRGARQPSVSGAGASCRVHGHGDSLDDWRALPSWLPLNCRGTYAASRGGAALPSMNGRPSQSRASRGYDYGPDEASSPE
ncbi:MAG: hypothetical protein M0Z54_14795 [Thermaerobacter sp.]|nr:hypothetical protein [Thermaerobacter sp.]